MGRHCGFASRPNSVTNTPNTSAKSISSPVMRKSPRARAATGKIKATNGTRAFEFLTLHAQSVIKQIRAQLVTTKILCGSLLELTRTSAIRYCAGRMTGETAAPLYLLHQSLEHSLTHSGY